MKLSQSEYDVFVCDDDTDLLVILLEELACMGLKAKSFEKAIPLLEELETAVPRLILTDFHMPKVSGMELAKTVRARGFKLPVIMISGDIAKKNIEMIQSIPGCYYLPKPFFSEEFQDFVQKALD